MSTSKEIIFKVDGKTLKTKQGESVLKACYTAYIDIPRFCYHEGLRIAGNCRMCLVEVANSRKLVASCATPLISSFSIFTKTFRVKKARQAVLEFLLINHPLDCPICDQGGECDLQDITLVFGGDRGRFYELSKRAVFDKNIGPLIKTVMNRCIHCTRCVRFFQETSFFDTDRLGLLGRGSSTEIGTYIPNFMLSELSGNVIDLCPVGALTSKPFAFRARSWELFSQYTYDVVDCFMPRVKFDLVGKTILRVLPYMGTYQSGWINNRSRFCYDALNLQRQESCLWNFSKKFHLFSALKSIRTLVSKVNIYINITWQEAFVVFLKFFLENLKSQINGFVSSILGLEQIWSIKQFFISLGSHKLFFEDYIGTYTQMDSDFRKMFVFDLPLELFNSHLWQIFLLNVNLRMEAPLLFLQVKKLFSKGILNFFTMGSCFLKNRHSNIQVGVSVNSFIKFLEGRSVNTRLVFKRLLFYKFLVLANVDLLHNGFMKILNLVLQRFFANLDNSLAINVKYSNNFNSVVFSKSTDYIFSIVQRYSGYISSGELALLNVSSSLGNIFPTWKNSSVLNICFDTSILLSTKLKSLAHSSSNVLFNATSFDLTEYDGLYDLIFPMKSIYEVELTYLDAFLKKKKAALILSVDSTRKGIHDILCAFTIYIKIALNYSWLCFFFSSLFINMKPLQQDFMFDIILGGNSDGAFLTSSASFNFIENLRVNLLFLNLFRKHKSLDCYSDLSFFFLNLTVVNIISSLNFYKDSKLNLVNFSKTMKQSSISYEQNYLNTAFTI